MPTGPNPSAPAWHETVTFIVAVFGAVLSIYNAWNARGAQRARKRQEAPFFMHDELLIFTRGQPGPDGRRFECFNYPPSHANVPEDYPDGEPVLLRAYNHGGDARLVETKYTDGRPCEQAEYWKLNEGHPQLQIYYPYSKERRGKIERFRVSYETVSGEKGEQILEHPHGLKGIKRIKIR